MVREVNSPKILSPDGSSRFLIMLQLIKILTGTSKKPLHMLDIGGGSPYMTHVLEELSAPYDLTTLDILPKPKGIVGKYIQGDATNMVFKDESYDVVVSTDVLEHIPHEKKEAFIEEAIRVTKDYLIIAAPFNTDNVEKAERLTNDFNIKLFGEGQSWLEEHFKNKKPELDQIKRTIESHKLDYEVIGTNNLYNWVLATHTNLIEAKYGLGKQKLIENNKRFNETILKSGDMKAPFYRHFVVVFKKELTAKQRVRIASLINQKIDDGSNLEYIHSIAEITAGRLAELQKTTTITNRKLFEANQTIAALRDELSTKNAIIESCRSYLRFIDLTPRKVAKKLIKGMKG